MYAWIWRHLPGRLVIRMLQALMLVTAIVTLLFLVVVPWLAHRLPYNDVATG